MHPMCVLIMMLTNVFIQNKHSRKQLQSSLLWQLVQKGACYFRVFVVG